MGRFPVKIDYENIRNAQISENQARLASLGLQKTISELRLITTPVKSPKKKYVKVDRSSLPLRRSNRLKQTNPNSSNDSISAVRSLKYFPDGDLFSSSVGANFTPHIINVNTGEDVTMKVISFSQQGPRAICILSANGVISSVTLRQPDSSGGTLTYEGRFEILSLAGSFTPSESGGIRNQSGGMNVSLASPDGRVVGGGVAGLLVAASPVQIMVGSILTGNQHEHKTVKKPKPEPVTPPPPVTAIPASTMTSAVETEESDPVTVKLNISSPSFRGDSWSAYNAHTPEPRKMSTDINVSLHG